MGQSVFHCQAVRCICSSVKISLFIVKTEIYSHYYTTSRPGFLPVTPETLYRPLGGASVLGRFHCLMENTGSPGRRHKRTKKTVNIFPEIKTSHEPRSITFINRSSCIWVKKMVNHFINTMKRKVNNNTLGIFLILAKYHNLKKFLVLRC